MPRAFTPFNFATQVNTGRNSGNAISQISNAGANIANLFRGIDTRQKTQDTQAFKDQLAGLSLDQLNNFNVNDVNSRLGAGQLQNILNANVTNKQNRVTAQNAFDISQRNAADAAGLDKILKLKNTAKNSNELAKIQAGIADGTFNISDHAKAQATADLRTLGTFLDKQNRERVNREQADASTNFINKAFKNTDSQLTFTPESLARLDSTIQNKVTDLNKSFGSNILVNKDKNGKLVALGNVDKEKFAGGIANNGNIPLLEKQRILDKYKNDPLAYYQDQINQTVDQTTLSTERNTRDLLNQAGEFAIKNGLDVNETQALFDGINSRTQNQFGLKGNELTDFQSSSNAIDANEKSNINALQTTVDTLTSSITQPLPFDGNANAKNKVKAIKNASEFIKESSDNFDGTFRPNTYGGADLIKQVNKIINNGFTIKDTGVKIKSSQLSGEMIQAALMSLHEQNNSIFNEGVNLPDLKNLLATFANDNDLFRRQNSSLLSQARTQLSEAIRTSSTRTDAAKNQAKLDIKAKRAVRQKVAQDRKNFIKFTRNN